MQRVDLGLSRFKAGTSPPVNPALPVSRNVYLYCVCISQFHLFTKCMAEQTANCKCTRPIEHLVHMTWYTRYAASLVTTSTALLAFHCHFLFRFLYHRWIWGPIRQPCCHWPSVAVPSSEVSPSLNMVHSIKQAPHFYPTHTIVKLLKSFFLGCGQQKKRFKAELIAEHSAVTCQCKAFHTTGALSTTRALLTSAAAVVTCLTHVVHPVVADKFANLVMYTGSKIGYIPC